MKKAHTRGASSSYQAAWLLNTALVSVLIVVLWVSWCLGSVRS